MSLTKEIHVFQVVYLFNEERCIVEGPFDLQDAAKWVAFCKDRGYAAWAEEVCAA